MRLSVTVRGVVQGVGFRPFVFGAAASRGLTGWVRNGTDGLAIEVQGRDEDLRNFLEALSRDPPPAARIEGIEVAEMPSAEDASFRILESALGAAPRPIIAADLATCPECLAENESPAQRRYRYPFTNCTRCGPRYSIIESLPYDRPRTSMKTFPPCADCAAEYDDPSDRRFHAQPIACPACGPAIRILGPTGECAGTSEDALGLAAETLRTGGVLALKGLGGFHLLADAMDEVAVERLRQRKGRDAKPFAVMFASLAAVRSACEVSAEEERALLSPEAPIVLLRRLEAQSARLRVADAVAPGSPWLGAMLPYTPLHQLLLSAIDAPVACTSGNVSGEPTCADEAEALARLGDIADAFLVHDRPIVRPVDDSVLRVGPSGIQVLRRARGFAPLPLRLAHDLPCVLALGGHLKSTVALSIGRDVVVSQHLGDLDSAEGVRLLERTARDLVRLFDARPEFVACDLHPDYASTRLAEKLAATWSVPLERIQHHHAHVAAVMAEHGARGPLLGFAWDGAGLGEDGTLWGGEALVVEGATARRVAHLRPFALPGGERAFREPRRAALGILHEIFGADALQHVDEAFRATDARLLVAMLERHVNSPRTTSMGRLFDAVASLASLRHEASFEGQAAMELEIAADGVTEDDAYPLPLLPGEPAVACWEPLIRAVLHDRDRGTPSARIAARFHEALACLAEELAVRVGLSQVVLSGGCFQNLRLARRIHQRLTARGFEVLAARLFPPNDGALALGQLAVAAQRHESR